ncbi:hypothetical protein CYJ73_03780 [Gordonia terrae]|uniref:Uncharacterized protein n=1 Tax=Gordonia terrae TaxID=2055 RepID=A0A2I1RCJ4_9ACTN|nr:hypothetical protein CYJ73_03780 [Gordonia terrae]
MPGFGDRPDRETETQDDPVRDAHRPRREELRKKEQEPDRGHPDTPPLRRRSPAVVPHEPNRHPPQQHPSGDKGHERDRRHPEIVGNRHRGQVTTRGDPLTDGVERERLRAVVREEQTGREPGEQFGRPSSRIVGSPAQSDGQGDESDHRRHMCGDPARGAEMPGAGDSDLRAETTQQRIQQEGERCETE